jgi:hypothetical protein
MSLPVCTGVAGPSTVACIEYNESSVITMNFNSALYAADMIPGNYDYTYVINAIGSDGSSVIAS